MNVMPPDSSDIPRESIWRHYPCVKWLFVAFVGFIGGYLLIDSAFIYRPRGGPDFRQELNNMRQIGFALIEFETEFGKMPDDTTIERVRERYPDTRVPMGNRSSNDYFHQFFAARIVENPSIFYGTGVATHRASEVVDGQPPLPPGTCGFAYIIRDGGSKPPTTPLVLYPLIRGELRFDQKLSKRHGNRVIILAMDNSAKSYPLDRKGRLIINGRDFFDPAQPHWGGGTFRVVWPE